LSLGTGLNKIKGQGVPDRPYRAFLNDLMLMGRRCVGASRWGLDLAKVPHRSGGVLAAMEVLKGRDVVPMSKSKTGRCLEPVMKPFPSVRRSARFGSHPCVQEQKEACHERPDTRY